MPGCQNPICYLDRPIYYFRYQAVILISSLYIEILCVKCYILLWTRSSVFWGPNHLAPVLVSTLIPINWFNPCNDSLWQLLVLTRLHKCTRARLTLLVGFTTFSVLPAVLRLFYGGQWIQDILLFYIVSVLSLTCIHTSISPSFYCIFIQ